MRKTLNSIQHLNLKYSIQGMKEMIYLPMKERLVIYTKNQDNEFSLNKINEIIFDDEILNFHLLKNDSHCNDILIIGKSNKKIVLYNQNAEKLSEFIHYKKVTNSFLYEEEGINYLVYSDKFGEIYIKPITSNLNSDDAEYQQKILYGHSDPIHFMKISQYNNIIMSTDIFGKIKISEFPNIFNFQSVLLYKNEDIKFCDFLSNRELIVLNSENNLHVWSTENFELISKHDLNKILFYNNDDKKETSQLEIVSMIPFSNNLLYVETANYYQLLENNRENSELIKRDVIEKKSEKIVKSFMIHDQNSYTILGITEEGNIGNIIVNKI